MDEFGKVYMSTVGCGIVYGQIASGEKPPVTGTTTKTTTTTTKTTTSASTTVTTSTTAPKTRSKDYVAGDVNCDGKIELADAILIMQALANPNKYGLDGTAPTHLTPQGRENADCSGGFDGMTSDDAAAIQRYLLRSLTALPEE